MCDFLGFIRILVSACSLSGRAIEGLHGVLRISVCRLLLEPSLFFQGTHIRLDKVTRLPRG